MIQLSYSPEKFKEIPQEVKEMKSQELDFTDDNPQRELHKREMDRRLWLGSEFLGEYSWDGLKKGEKYPGLYGDEKEDKEPENTGQAGLGDFI